MTNNNIIIDNNIKFTEYKFLGHLSTLENNITEVSQY